MSRSAMMAMAVVLTLGRAGLAQGPTFFVARPTEIMKLVDLNADGDFLDFAEVVTYAENLTANLGALVGDAGLLFVVDVDSAAILLVQDLNGDGDALDYAEVTCYALLPAATPPLVPAGLARLSDGVLLTAERTEGTIHRIADLNGDGDALDFAEVLIVADGFTSPTAVTLRPDGLVLIAQEVSAAPVRILADRNADDDYLDFAENLSYAESTNFGSGLAAIDDTLGFLTRPAEGTVVRLLDLNRDDDVLDFGEVLPYAENLDTPLAVACESADSLYVVAGDIDGTLYHVRDLNADGDALDFAEVVVVAQGLNQPTGIALTIAGCLKGDVNEDGIADVNDVPAFVDVLLGRVTPSDPCPADLNDDAQVNGADIQPFIDALLL